MEIYEDETKLVISQGQNKLTLDKKLDTISIVYGEYGIEYNVLAKMLRTVKRLRNKARADNQFDY